MSGVSLWFCSSSCRALLWGCFALVLASELRVNAQSGEKTLTTAAEVRMLSEQEAGRAIPTRLVGVFMGGADPEGVAFVLQDETEGIYVQAPPDLVAGLERGDLLELEGVTDPGGFAPFVVARDLNKIGRGRIPEPLRVSLDQLSAGQMDAKWVEISGIVRSVAPKEPGDTAPPPPGTLYAPRDEPTVAKDGKVKLKLAAGNARVMVEICEEDAEGLIDAEVRLRGLSFNLHNSNRQFVRPFVQVPCGVEVAVLWRPPESPLDTPPRPVETLLRFEQLNHKQGHRVHVRGVVIHHRLGSELWVRDGNHSLRVETAQTEALRPGDEVDVLGFPALGEYSPILQDAVFTKRAFQTPPAPEVLENVSSALQHDANLVQLEARLVEARSFPNVAEFTLEWQDAVIRATMQLQAGESVPADWLPGSVVAVAGVCSVVADEPGPLGGLWVPRAFELLLRSPADLSVLQTPPWWNAERVAWLLFGFLAVAVGAIAAITLASRRRLKEQDHRRAMAEAEFSAILNERNRVAREIHDTLSQSLGAISMQLELARTHAGELGQAVRTHLGTAHRLARSALAEARDSIWNMRSQVLEKCDIGEALERVLKQLTEGTGVKSTVSVEGARRRLPPLVENNLLRIGQEAITNASKHAQPSRIDVKLVLERRRVRLTVEDDGAGFVSGAKPSEGRPSFGLVGMRERAELLGGTVEIQSEPGRGTRVEVEVSV